MNSVYKYLGLIATMAVVPDGSEDDSPVSWQETLLTVTPNSTQVPPLHPCLNLKTSYATLEGNGQGMVIGARILRLQLPSASWLLSKAHPSFSAHL